MLAGCKESGLLYKGLNMSWEMWSLKKSIWLFHINTGSCGGCDMEIINLLTPKYDTERFGIKFVSSPRHADALLVTGIVTREGAGRLIEVYRQMSKPCIVFITGACACDSGIFHKSYNAAGPADKIIQDEDPNAMIMYVPGCPPGPEAIISAFSKMLAEL